MKITSPSLVSRRRFTASAVLQIATARSLQSTDRSSTPPFATPPRAYTFSDPKLRSPLLFENGQPVTTADMWHVRRQEIRKRWERIVGVWPKQIMQPKIDYLTTSFREGIQQKRIRLQIASDQTSDAYLLVPSGRGPFPAVFVPFYDPETSIGIGAKPRRDFAWRLAKLNYVALAIGSPGGDARKPVLAADATCQPLAYLGYIAANAWYALASMQEVDASRIGIVGHSYGGKWAMFGSCLSDKYACAVWSDPGIVFDEARPSINYQEPWYLGYDPKQTRKPGLVSPASPRTGAYKILIEQGLNLHELHALMAPRPFLVSGGAEDPPGRWTALQHTIEVNRLLGYHGRVAMTNRSGHDPTDESNQQIDEFFQHWLG